MRTPEKTMGIFDVFPDVYIAALQATFTTPQKFMISDPYNFKIEHGQLPCNYMGVSQK